MSKLYHATANFVGKHEYNLERGKTYKVEVGNYGVIVYDIFGNYITETRLDAFNNYREIKQ